MEDDNLNYIFTLCLGLSIIFGYVLAFVNFS